MITHTDVMLPTNSPEAQFSGAIITTAKTKPAVAMVQPAPEHFRFPDPPEQPSDKKTNFGKMSRTGNVYLRAGHLGNPETTPAAGEDYHNPAPTRSMADLRYPDLLVAFEAAPAACYRSNAYVISGRGKPPDFVLEIASPSAWREDIGPKRDAYVALSIGEYWRFDETGKMEGSVPN